MDPVALNKMLEGRVKELASMRRGNSKEDLETRLKHVLQAAGLFPLPAKTSLNAQVTGTLQREGYRIEKVRYESRSGLPATAHLYLPEGQGPWPLVVSSHGTWKGKKAAPVVQARGIAFALRGFATLIVDAPGSFGDDLALDERGGVGPPGDPALLMGAPWLGAYAWDLIRGLDSCLGRPDIDAARIGIAGEGDGGIATLIAFVAEVRFACAAFICTAPSMEQKSLETMAQLCLPGIATAGDFADMLAIRGQSPTMFVSAAEDDRFDRENVAKTADKRGKAARYETFEGGHDFNRRMREAVAAFFAEHLQSALHRSYLPELRPLTDGALNPYPAGTVPGEDPEMLVTAPADRVTATFQDLLHEALANPHPEPLHPQDRLVPWLKFANPGRLESGVTIGLHDSPSVPNPKLGGSIPLLYELVDMRLAAMTGLSVAEFLAQVLHVTLPGRPETWEKQAITGGEGLSAMIASVKTLVQSASPETVPTKVVAEGPVASLTACFLKLYRPSIEVETTHEWTSWRDLLGLPIPQLIQPQARYLDWPF